MLGFRPQRHKASLFNAAETEFLERMPGKYWLLFRASGFSSRVKHEARWSAHMQRNAGHLCNSLFGFSLNRHLHMMSHLWGFDGLWDNRF